MLIFVINLWPREWSCGIASMSYVRRARCMPVVQHWQCLSCQRRDRLCAGEHLIQSYLSILVSQTPSLGSDASPPPPLHEAVVVPM